MWLFTILAVVIAFLIFLDYSYKKGRYDKTQNIPGPLIVPIIGNYFIFQRRQPKDAMYFMEHHVRKYGSLLKIWIFHKLAIMSTNPKDLEIVLSGPKYIKKNYLYNFLRMWLGNGLLLSDGSKWHSRRKIITPTFHFKILEQFVEIFDQQSAILVQKLQSHLDEKAFNIYPYITLAALDVVSETAMGTKINAQTDPNCEYVRAVTDITDVIIKRFVNIWFRNDFIFKILGSELKRKQDHALEVLHNFTETIIEERRNCMLKSSNLEQEQDDGNDVGSKKKMALLDVLLQAEVNGKPLSNEEIREEVDTFMFEGHDTTTSAICFGLYCISRHPEVQKKLFEEILQVIGDDKTKSVTYRDLQELKYMECVIKETLRLYPSVPVIGRQLIEDVNINGQIVPAGANFTIPIYIMHKNPEIFPEPEKFIPERHLIENTTNNINPYAFIPFSAGPRNCIGQKFAMLEMKSTISKILRHYELLPLGPEPEPILNLILRSMNGINLGIKQRVN